MFVNGLRSKRGKMELVSRISSPSPSRWAVSAASPPRPDSAWYFVSQGKAEFLAILLWPIFFFWQVFPVMATAFTNNPDSSDLLRFPLTYRSYFLIRLAYGFFDPASALGTVGVARDSARHHCARPLLFPWALLVLLTFALFNLVLMQTIFAWVERWLAQRRTREIMGVLFILRMLSFQLIGPAMQTPRKRPRPELQRAVQIVTQVQAVLPPGLAANAIAQASHAKYVVGFTSLLFLGTLTMAVGYLLHLRLRRQFRGENLSEAAARPVVAPGTRPADGMGPAGIFAVRRRRVRKRNALPRPQRSHAAHPDHAGLHAADLTAGTAESHAAQSHFLDRTPDMAFPGAAAYALLVLTNLVYNSFGGDGGGIQFFYASPVTFRQIVLGKNLTHAAILAGEHGVGLVRRDLLLRRSPSGGLGRNRRRTSVRRAFELHRRQPALDLHSQEARFLNLRPPERLADDGPGQSGRADRDRWGWNRCVFRRALLQESVDRSPSCFLALSAISIPLYIWFCAASTASRRNAGKR